MAGKKTRNLSKRWITKAHLMNLSDNNNYIYGSIISYNPALGCCLLLAVRDPL